MKTDARSAGWRHEAGRFSSDVLARLRAFLDTQAPSLAGVECIAVAGSLARREAGPCSDVDCVLVVRDTATPEQVAGARDALLAAIDATGLRAPRPDGIFRQAVTVGQLLDPAALGALDEAPAVYGKRLQLLTDTTAVLDADRFRYLRGAVLDWFVRWQPADRPYAGLLSELVRYRRSYCAWQRFRFTHDATDGWRLRMAKLASSRLVTVSGLIFLLGEAARRGQAPASLSERLDMPALARTLAVVGAYDDALARRVEAAYVTVQAGLEEPGCRQRLVDAAPVGLADLAGGQTVQIGAGMDAALAALSRDLNGFLLDRRADWPAWVFEAMLL